jgi:hypothetical protein
MSEDQKRDEEKGQKLPVHCRNCGEPIVWTGNPPTGWTHGDPSNLRSAWKGKRCPGRITGAVPDTDRLAREAYGQGRDDEAASVDLPDWAMSPGLHRYHPEEKRDA